MEDDPAGLPPWKEETAPSTSLVVRAPDGALQKVLTMQELVDEGLLDRATANQRLQGMAAGVPAGVPAGGHLPLSIGYGFHNVFAGTIPFTTGISIHGDGF